MGNRRDAEVAEKDLKDKEKGRKWRVFYRLGEACPEFVEGRSSPIVPLFAILDASKESFAGSGMQLEF